MERRTIASVVALAGWLTSASALAQVAPSAATNHPSDLHVGMGVGIETAGFTDEDSLLLATVGVGEYQIRQIVPSLPLYYVV